MIILVTGPRIWKIRTIVEQALLPYKRHTLRQGGAAGLDMMAMRIGETLGMIIEKPWKPDYARYDMRAPFQRNEDMVDAGINVCLAFLMPCPAGEDCPKFRTHGPHWTHGTDHCMNYALSKGVRVEWYTETTSWRDP